MFRNILGDLDFDSMDQIWSTATPIYFYGFVVLIMFIFVNIFIAIINDSFSLVSSTLPPDVRVG